jgi:glycerophosphoryl diester phosphodiesterase
VNAAAFRRRDGSSPYVFGHRGVRGAAPENTMAAFDVAARAGADGIELDVRLCRSGELVVCHDPTLERLTAGRDVRRVADLDADEISRVDVGDGQGVPLLRDVFGMAQGRGLRVNVELKRDVPSRPRLVGETVRMLRDLGPFVPRVLVSSFDPWMLAYLGWLLPGVLRGYLFAPSPAYLRTGWPAIALGADAVHPERTLCRADRIRRWRARGKLINVWTVNDADEARALSALGVDAIITDAPRAIIDAVR